MASLSGKDLRPRSRFNAQIIMEVAHPLFLMKVYSKFEISEKNVSNLCEVVLISISKTFLSMR